MYERDWMQWHGLKAMVGGALALGFGALTVALLAHAPLGTLVAVGGCALMGLGLVVSGLMGRSRHRRMEQISGEPSEGTSMMEFAREQGALLVGCAIAGAGMLAIMSMITVPPRPRSTEGYIVGALIVLAAATLAYPMRAFGQWEDRQRARDDELMREDEVVLDLGAHDERAHEEEVEEARI